MFRASVRAVRTAGPSSRTFIGALVRRCAPPIVARTCSTYNDIFSKTKVAELPADPAPHARRIFVNNEFSMGEVDVIGFDYDYTLANYTERLPNLVYDLAMSYLVTERRYPGELIASGCPKYDPDFACRGISFDRKTGLLLKMDSFSSVQLNTVHRGRTRLTPREVREVYGSASHVRVRYRDEYMRPLVDLFAVAEANVLANTIQYLNDNDIQYSPSAVSDDVIEAIEWVHMSGEMHNIVSNNLSRFVQPDEHLAPLLQRFRDEGKELFLLTNSSFDYIDAGLNFLLGDQWRKMFDYVMTLAQKPKFYTRARPFRELDPQSETVRWTSVNHFKKNRVYVQGSVKHMLRMTGWHDKRVLYIGDSMYSDWKEPAISYGWTIGGIVSELEEHINKSQTPQMLDLDKKLSLMEEVCRRAQFLDPNTPDGYATLAALYKAVTADGTPSRSLSVTTVMDALERERTRLREQQQRSYNKNFGSIFLSDTSPTLFAFGIMRYVDFYTSHLTNFLEYPANCRFNPPSRLMPHQDTVEVQRQPAPGEVEWDD